MSKARSKTQFRKALALALFPLPIFAAAAKAQPEPTAGRLPAVVVTASRLATSVDRVPASVSVVTRREIDRNAWTTLPEALRSLPGATVVSSGGPGANTSVFMRGNNSDHVLVLLDGMPINDPAAAAGAFNFGDDLLGGLDRIEIVRGPASSLYGSNAIGGVVNLIAAVGADRPVAATLDAGLGTDATWRGTAGLRGTLDRFDYGISLEGFSTAGDNGTPARFTTRNLGESDGFDNLTATAKAAYRLDGARLEGLLRWRDAQFDIDNAASDDPNSTGTSKHLAWQTALSGDPIAGRLSSRIAVGQSRFDRTFSNRRDALSAATSDDTFDSVRTHLDIQNDLAFPSAGGITDAVLTFGGSFNRDEAEFRVRSTSAFGPFTQDVDATADTAALFAKTQARIGGTADLTAGVRFDSPDDYGNRVTWRLGGTAPLGAMPVRVKAAAGTAYKAPTLYDRFGRTNLGYRGNPNLDAESSFGWEAGVEADVPAHGRRDFAGLSAIWFTSDVDNLIQFDFARNTSVNIAEAEIEGVESQATLRPSRGLEIGIGWTWTDARNARTGQRLLRRPEHQVSLDARIEPLRGLTISPEAVFVGQRLDVIYANSGGFIGTRRVGGFWQFNLAVVWQISQSVDLYARGTNLMDRTIEDPNGYARPDRGGLIGLRAQF